MKKRFFLRIFFPGALLCIILLAISCDSDKLWTNTNEISPESQALLLALALQKNTRTVQTGPYHIIVDATSFLPSHSITLRSGFQYLTITGPGTYTFPYGLADGASFNVVISAGPTPVDGLDCSNIAPSSGVINAADVTVTMTCSMP